MSKRYRVTALACVEVSLGEVEAQTKTAALNRVMRKAPSHISLCHQCSREVGDDLQIDDSTVKVEVIEEE